MLPPATEQPDAARLAARSVTVLEVASVISTVLLIAWIINPLQLQHRWLEVIPAGLALLLMLYSHWLRGETPSMLGFTAKYFGRAVKLLLLPMLITGGVLVGVGSWAGSLHIGARFWLALAVLPFWGVTQQYILQGFIYRRLKIIIGATNPNATIVLAALLFALVHAPNLPLMMLTFIGGLVWTWVYERAPNLFALGLSHAVMSALAMSSLPAWFLQSMSIGYKHLIFQRF